MFEARGVRRCSDSRPPKGPSKINRTAPVVSPLYKSRHLSSNIDPRTTPNQMEPDIRRTATSYNRISKGNKGPSITVQRQDQGSGTAHHYNRRRLE